MVFTSGPSLPGEVLKKKITKKHVFLVRYTNSGISLATLRTYGFKLSRLFFHL